MSTSLERWQKVIPEFEQVVKNFAETHNARIYSLIEHPREEYRFGPIIRIAWREPDFVQGLALILREVDNQKPSIEIHSVAVRVYPGQSFYNEFLPPNRSLTTNQSLSAKTLSEMMESEVITKLKTPEDDNTWSLLQIPMSDEEKKLYEGLGFL